MINEAGFNNAFYYCRYDREVYDWAIVRELIVVYDRLFKQWRNDRFVENVVAEIKKSLKRSEQLM